MRSPQNSKHAVDPSTFENFESQGPDVATLGHLSRQGPGQHYGDGFPSGDHGETVATTIEPIVSVRGLSKIYYPSALWLRFLLRSAIDEPVHALTDIDLEIFPGQIAAVVGPNGAGKSTLFRILTGLTTPTSGSASVLGNDVVTEAPALRRVVGFMPADERTLYLRHTCRENLRFHGRLQGIALRPLLTRVDEVLELVGLGHAAERAGFALSTGMRARLMLARALLHHPKVLILDEPTGAVDPVGSYELLELIKRIVSEENIGVLISSHRLEEIEALHDRALFLDHGRIVYQGNLDDLRRTLARPRLHLRFSTGWEASAAAAEIVGDDVDLVSCEGSLLTIATEVEVGQILAMIPNQLRTLVEIEQARTSLRELLMELYRRGGVRDPEAVVTK
jgi:ABC-2 type transport system ATP-binding protein